jgi:uncharacterized membrane protein
MPSPQRTWTEGRLEAVVGNLLRVGVMLAAAVVCLGGALYLIRHGGSVPHYGVFHGEPADLRSVSGVVTDAMSLQGRGVIQLGLLLLLATPVARVAFSAFAFAQQGDRMYVIITLAVLAVLLYSLVGGYL